MYNKVTSLLPPTKLKLEVQSYILLGDSTVILFLKEVSLKYNDIEQNYLF
jgi:hypothetical protein